MFTDKKPDICATDIIQNSSNHIATLRTGHIGFIEVPITNEKPKFYQISDINTLIHNVTHTYHSEITEQVPQTNYTVRYSDSTTPPLQFSPHHIYRQILSYHHKLHLFIMFNLLLTLQKRAFFLKLPCTSENLKFINKLNFQFSDLTDTEYITLCNLLLE